MRLTVEPLATWISAFVELALAAMAVDAYRLARKRLPPTPELLGTTPIQLEPSSSVAAGVPLALAGLLTLGYVGVLAVGLTVPSYDTIDQSQATYTETEQEKTYTNPKYGIEARIPADWEFDQSDPDYFFEAVTLGGGCSVGLMPDSAMPFVSTEATADNLTEGILSQNDNFHLRDRKSARLAGLEGVEVIFTADIEGTEVTQRYLVAQKGLSTYWLITTLRSSLVEVCGEGFESIRGQITISK